MRSKVAGSGTVEFGVAVNVAEYVWLKPPGDATSARMSGIVPFVKLITCVLKIPPPFEVPELGGAM